MFCVALGGSRRDYESSRCRRTICVCLWRHTAGDGNYSTTTSQSKFLASHASWWSARTFLEFFEIETWGCSNVDRSLQETVALPSTRYDLLPRHLYRAWFFRAQKARRHRAAVIPRRNIRYRPNPMVCVCVSDEDTTYSRVDALNWAFTCKRNKSLEHKLHQYRMKLIRSVVTIRKIGLMCQLHLQSQILSESKNRQKVIMRHKVVVIGDVRVGKSCLLAAFARNCHAGVHHPDQLWTFWSRMNKWQERFWSMMRLWLFRFGILLGKNDSDYSPKAITEAPQVFWLFMTWRIANPLHMWTRGCKRHRNASHWTGVSHSSSSVTNVIWKRNARCRQRRTRARCNIQCPILWNIKCERQNYWRCIHWTNTPHDWEPCGDSRGGCAKNSQYGGNTENVLVLLALT